MDEEFGIGDLVEEAFAGKKSKYTSDHLRGLTVKHDIDRFKDGRNVILTLEDKGRSWLNAGGTGLCQAAVGSLNHIQWYLTHKRT